MIRHEVLNLKQVQGWLNRTFDQNSYNYIVIASSPHQEKCTPAGEYPEDGILECRILIDQMIRTIGDPPDYTAWVVVENYHEDAGIYHEAGIIYVDAIAGDEGDMTESTEYALEAEASVPDRWDKISLEQLKIHNHRDYTGAVVVDMEKPKVVKIKKK